MVVHDVKSLEEDTDKTAKDCALQVMDRIGNIKAMVSQLKY